jgi:ribonuclease HIII
MVGRRKQTLNFNKNHFEKEAWDRSNRVIGIDEVGRGCLAGPLVTAAVILPIGNVNRLDHQKLYLSSGHCAP